MRESPPSVSVAPSCTPLEYPLANSRPGSVLESVDNAVWGTAAHGDDLAVSFEFFPPKNPHMETALWQTLHILETLAPRFVSVTYGAGGSTRERTHHTVAKIAAHNSTPVAAHLTCVGASREEIDAIAHGYWEAGVRHIVALRGDLSDGNGGGASHLHPNGYANAAELVAGLRRCHDFDISVAAYPETHPQAASPQSDLDTLKRKLDAGASRAISQFFFTPELFLRFRDRAAAAGISAPIIPGILPISNVASTRRIAAMCGTAIPPWLDGLFAELDMRPTTRQLVAATVATDICRRLYAGGVRDFHFYTLNRAELSYAICHLLGLRPRTALNSEDRVPPCDTRPTSLDISDNNNIGRADKGDKGIPNSRSRQ